MTKRQREPEDGTATPDASTKRSKLHHPDGLSNLSDELILKVLSNLTVSQLVGCQSLSRKYRRLGADQQLWKEHFYNRFVKPRASRVPGLKDAGSSKDALHFTSKASAWLDDEHLAREGAETDWRQQYKLRHKWSKGSCAVNEIAVAEQAPVPPILVQMQDRIIYTVDFHEGLRAWSTRDERKLIASIALDCSEAPFFQPSAPTSVAIDTQAPDGYSSVLVGFENGSFSIFSLVRSDSKFQHRYTHPASSRGVLTAVAVTWPFVMTMAATQHLSLYRFSQKTPSAEPPGALGPPRLLHSLTSHTVWPPLSTSLKVSPSSVSMCVAYSLPTYLSGWTVGIQEVKVDRDGELLSSRNASAINPHYRPLAFSAQPTMHHLGVFAAGPHGASPLAELRHIHAKPTSLSYTHPYLLVSHPDNTLTLYLVTSTTETLSISPGSRLWGHTSSVSGAHVGGRGKAVSVSQRGDELRIWELEGGFTSSTARKRLAGGNLSVQIKPQHRHSVVGSEQPRSGLDFVQDTGSPHEGEGVTAVQSDADEASELTLTRGWIGFDDERVVFLKEENQGKQALVVYDFT